ncbi:MAG: flagellar hook-length control protein FliK [Deltaproteobacteria bacterium]|jgi:predicted  nucleic acid-binding Zn-ribbon protein|nr:flagellar hook-length control protein FliK [Deltaproteobacteria bacterium]
MQPVISYTTTKIEVTSAILPVDYFDASFTDDFERVLAQAEDSRNNLAKETTRVSEELKEARQELEEQLKSRRERIKNELSSASQKASSDKDAASSFGADRVSQRTALKAVVLVGSVLPDGYKNQLGSALMATGNETSGLNGWLLTGGARPTELLKATLEELGGLSSRFKLDSEGLSELRQILSDSGLESDDVSSLMSALVAGPLTLDRVLLTASKADNLAASAQAALEAANALLATGDSQIASGSGFTLTATSAGLNSLGQFFLSLGLSAQTVQAVTAGITVGQKLTSQDLANLLSQAGDDILAPCLNDGDIVSLTEAFKAMGADQKVLGSLAVLLGQGQATLGDLTGFLAFLEQPKPQGTDMSQTVKNIQELLTKTTADGSLVKAPVFNEIVIKLASLGDRELTGDFSKLSPALQALRGGISGLRESGAQSYSGSGRDSREDRERALNTYYGSTSESTVRGDGLVKGALFSEALSYTSGETLAKQIEQKLVYSARRGVHRLRMSLAPESLGELDIELKVDNDKLTAHIKADTLEAYEALEKEIKSLKKSLAEAGLQLAMTISYDGQNDKSSSYARTGYQGASSINKEKSNESSITENEAGILVDNLSNHLVDTKV